SIAQDACANSADASAQGPINRSELGLRDNGLAGIVNYLLRAKKKADLVLRVFDQNDNRVGTSPTKTIIRPPADPPPLPSNDVFFVPSEVVSKNCHALGGDDVKCGSSISLFPNSKSLYAQALMIDQDNGTVLARSPKVLYNIIPFRVELGTVLLNAGP